MHGAWDLQGVVPVSPNLGIGGLFGEILRSYYAPTAPSTVPMMFDGSSPWRWGSTAPGSLGPRCPAELRKGRPVGGAPARGGRAPLQISPMSTTPSIACAAGWVRSGMWWPQPVADPLQLNGGFRTALAMGHDLRRVGAIPFELIRRLCEAPGPGTAGRQGMAPGERAMAPDPDRYDVPPVTGGGGGGHRWQDQRFPVLVPVFAAELLNGRGNPLLEMLDRERVAEVLSGRRRLNAHGKTALWATLAAAIWIDGGELPSATNDTQSPRPAP